MSLLIKAIDPGFKNNAVVFFYLRTLTGKIDVKWAANMDLCKGQSYPTFMANHKFDYLDEMKKEYVNITNPYLEAQTDIVLVEAQMKEKLAFVAGLLASQSRDAKVQLISAISLRTCLAGNSDMRASRKRRGMEYLKFLIKKGIVQSDDSYLLKTITENDHLTDAVLLGCYYSAFRLGWKKLYARDATAEIEDRVLQGPGSTI